MASIAAGGLRGAVLLFAPGVASSSYDSSSRALTGIYWDGSTSSCYLRTLIPSRGRKRRGSRFETVKASKDDEFGTNQNSEPNNEGKKGPVDWDKAWSSYSKPLKKKSFLKLDMEKYVSRRPTHSNYPLSEEVDPLRKSERSALSVWTSLNFTYSLVFVIIGLAVYMVIIVGPPPHH